MFEIIKDVMNGVRDASDITGFALWWIGKTFWFWFFVVAIATTAVLILH